MTPADRSRIVFVLLLVVVFLGTPLMPASQPSTGHAGAPMRGPDFVLEKVKSWVERPGANAELLLGDGSLWKLKPGTQIYEAQRAVIEGVIRRNAELFVSGDKQHGLIDRLTDASPLAVQEISSTENSGRYSVAFWGPPSIYHLRMDRPWSTQALPLLRQSATSGASFGSPDLLVAIDPVTLEIVAVRPLASGKGATRH